MNGNAEYAEQARDIVAPENANYARDIQTYIDSDPYLQSPEINERAAALVMRGIKLYPQRIRQAEKIIADKLLAPYRQYRRADSGVRIIDMARLLPDPLYCQTETNRIHKVNNIPYKVFASAAAETVSLFAVGALEHIFNRTRNLAEDTGTIPPSLAETDIYPEPEERQYSTNGPWSVNHSAVYIMRNYLSGNPDVAAAVADQVHSDAQHVLSRSAAHRAEIQRLMARPLPPDLQA
jgi:hypothetical protein